MWTSSNVFLFCCRSLEIPHVLSPELSETVVEETVVGDDVADTESKKLAS